MKKIFSLLAAVLFAGSMFAETITITPASGFKSAYNNAGTFAIGDVEFAFNAGVMYNGKGTPAGFASKQLIQFRKSGSGAGEFANNTSLDLKSITIATQNDKPYTLSVGTSADELSAASNPTTSTGKYACKDNLDADKEIDVTLHTYDVEGNNYFQFVNGANAQYIAYITIELAGGEVPPVEPTEEYYLTGSIRNWAQTADDDYKFVVNTAAEGEYMLQGITLAANDELKVIGIVGETVNWYPAGQDNNYVVAADGTYDIYFRPDGQGGQDWHQGYFYVAEVVPQTAMSLTEFIEAAPTTEVTLKPLTVIFASGKNTYVIDEDGVALVIFDTNKTYYDGTLTAGKVLTGQKATYTKYKNQDEIVPTNTAAVSDGVAPTPTELNAAPTDANINHYVSFKNVAAAANNGKYYIYEDFLLYGATGALKPTEEGNYDVEGIYILYNETVPEIIVTALAPASATAINNTADEIKAFKTIENGQLVIIKNGVRYDATGAVIR